MLLSLCLLALLSVAAAVPAQAQQSDALCQPQVLGNRRIPKETILARMFSRAGDAYDATTVERDFNSLWNTGYFEDVRIEREDTPKCVQLIVVVREKPTIREIVYKGLNVISQSDLLDRFKKEKVGLSVESQYDPEKVAHARAVLLAVLERTRPPVRQGHRRVQDHPARPRQPDLQYQGRSHGQGRPHQV